jgi:hypothetical protein
MQAFLELLRLARQMGLLTVGVVSDDGTHIKANASKHKILRYDRAGELERLLLKDIEVLLARAEKSGTESTGDEQKLPGEIARREANLEKMRWARAELENRAEPPPPEGGGFCACRLKPTGAAVTAPP